MDSMAQERTVVSWRSSFSDATLSALIEELPLGVPDAGVEKTFKRKFALLFISRLDRACAMLKKTIDHDKAVEWEDPQAWWYDLAKTISPFGEALPDTWPQNSRPVWLSILEDINIREHIPLHTGNDHFPMCHCNLCYPEERVRAHVNDGEALACMALCNAYDMHTHARCDMHLESVKKLRHVPPPVAARDAIDPPVAAPPCSEADVLARLTKLEESFKELRQTQELKHTTLCQTMNDFISRAEKVLLDGFRGMREESLKRGQDPTANGDDSRSQPAPKKLATTQPFTGKGGSK